MNPTPLAARPLLSTRRVSANPQQNSRLLNELLPANPGKPLAWRLSRRKGAAPCFSQRSDLGVDEINQPMEGLTPYERGIITLAALVNAALLGAVVYGFIN